MVYTFEPPLSVIETWPKANYDHPSTRGPGLFIATAILSTVGIATVSARLYSRLFLTRAPGLDDAVIVLGLLLSLGLASLIITGNELFGANRHIWDIPFSMLPGHRRNIFASEWLYVLAAASIKISILLFYRRLSVSFNHTFRIAVIIGFIYNVAVVLVCLIWILVLCQPIHAFWKSYDPKWTATHKFHCRSEQVSLPLSASLNVLGDLYSTLLPFFLIRDVARSPRQKLALYCLFAMGFLTVVCGTARAVYLYRILNVDWDMTWQLSPMWTWTLVELHVGILAASAPALKPFFRRFVGQPVSKIVSNRGTAPSPFPGKLTDASRQRDSSRMSHAIDPEKIGVAHGDPAEMKLTPRTSWKEVEEHDEVDECYEMHQRVSSGLATLDEESTISSRSIAIAR